MASTDRFIVVVKSECPTCSLIQPVCAQLADCSDLTIYSQDDPGFPDGIPGVKDDRSLESSFRLGIEIVPTLIRFRGELELERVVGWDRSEWERITRCGDLGPALPDFRPGCGSLSVAPGVHEELIVRFGSSGLRSRKIEVIASEDPHEVCFDRGWSDGLAVVPPTEVRVLNMVRGTSRDPGEIIGKVPPNMGTCTVEKIAINAVMAGCRPEYMPVVVAAVEAALAPELSLHGVLATSDFIGPVVIVNGPVTRRIGMNSGVNCLGQGNRANGSIGRAVQLVIRNVGGAIPGGVDRSTLGQPGKYTFCFAEDESDLEWEPLSVERGFSRSASTVTLFAGGGVQGIWDELSRTPDALVRSLALALEAVGHPDSIGYPDAILVLSPDHYRVFQDARWTKARMRDEVLRTLARLRRDRQSRDKGFVRDERYGRLGPDAAKFRPGGLIIVRAGGPAGLVSGIIAGPWGRSGPVGSQLVSKEIRS